MTPVSRTRRSWVDVVIGWVERAPGPPWLFYTVVAVVLGIVSIIIRWADGSVPYPGVNPIAAIFTAATVYCLAVVHYLNLSARRALREFRPALGDLEPQYDALDRELTRTPVWVSLVAIPLGLTVLSIGLLSSFGSGKWGVSASSSLGTNVFSVVAQVVLNVTFWVFVLRTLRQIGIIVRIHRDATGLRLYDAGPHGAFARFTLATAVSVTGPYAVVEIIVVTVSGVAAVEISVLVLAILLSIALFSLPLLGIHRRLADEKQRMLSDAQLRFGVAAAALHTQVDAGDFDHAGGISTVMERLGQETDQLRKVSTWPWSTGTISGFVSSIVLPVVVFVLTTLIARLIP